MLQMFLILLEWIGYKDSQPVGRLMSALNHSPKLRMEQVSAFKAMYVDKQIHSKYHKSYFQDIKIVQQVKAPVAKLYDLSFISRIRVIGKNQLPQVDLRPPHVYCDTHTPISLHRCT